MSTDLLKVGSNNQRFALDWLELYRGSGGLVLATHYTDDDGSEKLVKFWISDDDAKELALMLEGGAGLDGK